MNECVQRLGNPINKSVDLSEGEGRSSEKRRVASSNSVPLHSAGNPVSEVAINSEPRMFQVSAQMELDPCAKGCKTKITSSTVQTKGDRHVGVQDEDQNVRNSTQDVVDHDSITLKPAQLRKLVNQVGFGNVLNERQLFRHRKEFPKIESEDGKINLLKYIAALCKKRSRSPMSETKGKLNLGDLYDLLESQDYCCALTGKELTPDDVALDHIVPISEGGSFSKENSQLVSKAANRAKNTMSQADFIQLCRDVASSQRSPRY